MEHAQLVSTIESSEAQLVGIVADWEEKLLRQASEHEAEVQAIRSQVEQEVAELRAQVVQLEQARIIETREAAEKVQQLGLQLSASQEESASRLILVDAAEAQKLEAQDFAEVLGTELRAFRVSCGSILICSFPKNNH